MTHITDKYGPAVIPAIRRRHADCHGTGTGNMTTNAQSTILLYAKRALRQLDGGSARAAQHTALLHSAHPCHARFGQPARRVDEGQQLRPVPWVVVANGQMPEAVMAGRHARDQHLAHDRGPCHEDLAVARDAVAACKVQAHVCRGRVHQTCKGVGQRWRWHYGAARLRG